MMMNIRGLAVDDPAGTADTRLQTLQFKLPHITATQQSDTSGSF